MKKTLIALAALAATGAFAQSAVTLSGSINYGVSTATTGVHAYGGWKGDRNHVTFAAVEDLGGGLKVSATAQLRYNSASAEQSTSYVSSTTGARGDNLFEQTKLAVDSQFGQIAFGRFTNAVGVAPVHVLEDSAQSTASAQAANGRWSAQTQYLSPVVAGFQVFALNAQKRNNNYLGAGSGAGYNAAFNMSTQDVAATRIGTERWANANFVGLNYSNGPVYAQYYTLTDFLGVQSTKLSGTYDLGFIKLFANQFNQKGDIQTQVASAAVAAVASTANLTTGAVSSAVAAAAAKPALGMAAHKATELAVNVPYGSWNFQLGRFNANKNLDLATPTAGKTAKTGWGATYALSKRTTAIYAASTTTNGSANLNSGGLVTGRNQFVGLQHTF